MVLSCRTTTPSTGIKLYFKFIDMVAVRLKSRWGLVNSHHVRALRLDERFFKWYVAVTRLAWHAPVTRAHMSRIEIARGESRSRMMPIRTSARCTPSPYPYPAYLSCILIRGSEL